MTYFTVGSRGLEESDSVSILSIRVWPRKHINTVHVTSIKGHAWRERFAFAFCNLSCLVDSLNTIPFFSSNAWE